MFLLLSIINIGLLMQGPNFPPFPQFQYPQIPQQPPYNQYLQPPHILPVPVVYYPLPVPPPIYPFPMVPTTTTTTTTTSTQDRDESSYDSDEYVVSYGEKELEKSRSNEKEITAFNSYLTKLASKDKIHNFSKKILISSSKEACTQHDSTKFEKTFGQCIEKDRRFKALSSKEKRKIKDLFYAIYSPESKASSETKSGDYKKNKEYLRKIAQQTMHTVAFGGFKNVRIDPAMQNRMINNTVLTSRGSLQKRTQDLFQNRCPVKVYNQDTFDCAYGLKQKGHKVAVLNMANPTHVGGGWKNGARAQEEELFRRSNLHKALDGNQNLIGQMGGKYLIKTNQAVYSPEVQVFRRSGRYQKPYQEHTPFDVDVISAAAPKKGTPYYPQDPNKYDRVMTELIENVLDTAIANGEDSIVLGAIGCGAFGHDSQRVANIFQKVLLNDYYRKNFKEIAFAVINDHNSSTNYNVFNNTLSNLV